MRRTETPRLQRWLLRACVIVPLLMLAANLLAWLRWGTDLPMVDDWRVYDERNALSLAPARLFEAINNTLTPVGLVLDVLAQRWFGGNPLPYQTVSMLGVLGGLLWLQWRLLSWVLRRTEWAALAFAFSVFMLQSDTYWGAQNLAYHQALPLVALLAAMSLTLRGGWPAFPRVSAIFVLGVVAGLTYISGAVAAFVIGVAWTGLAWRLGHERTDPLLVRVAHGGWALVAAGGATSALQIVLTRRAAPGSRVQYMGLTWPDQSDFWLFMAGKLGRSSGAGFASLALEVAWVALLIAVIAAAAAWTVGRCFRGGHQQGGADVMRRRLALVFLPLLAAVLAYLALVSLGRTGLREASVQSPEAVFRLAYLRFHFFWATLLYPWLAATLIVALLSVRGHAGAVRWLLVVPVAVGGLVILAALPRGVFNVQKAYKETSLSRMEEIRCLSRQIGTGHPIDCPLFVFMNIPDATRAYRYGLDIRASFTRYFPIVEREHLGADLLRWDAGSTPLPDVEMTETQPADGPGSTRLLVKFKQAEAESARCRIMGVRLALRETAGASAIRLFHRPPGSAEFKQEWSVQKSLGSAATSEAEIEFALESRSGFAPVLRVDVVGPSGRVDLSRLRVACRLRSEP